MKDDRQVFPSSHDDDSSNEHYVGRLIYYFLNEDWPFFLRDGITGGNISVANA
jgi:hypothetical protein